jgi:hypothetical protein
MVFSFEGISIELKMKWLIFPKFGGDLHPAQGIEELLLIHLEDGQLYNNQRP